VTSSTISLPFFKKTR